MAKKLSEMSFVEFTEAAKPSGAVNRYPAIGQGADVFSYSIYMNGPILKELPQALHQHEFKDVMVHALTEKLNLDPLLFRDNLKVAELVAARSAWMSAVLEQSLQGALPEHIEADYELLTKGLTHPWIQAELANQRALTAQLQSTLASASEALGTEVIDQAPDEISKGKVVLQNGAFTVQRTSEGRVVTHENRRLNELPTVGSDVTVSYYRGSGQVFESHEIAKVSPTFIDQSTGDLAITLTDAKGKDQVVLFNSVSSIDKFVKAHAITVPLVTQAMNLREENPKPLAPVVKKEKVGEVYLEETSGCIGIDYRESGVTYSALFASANALEKLSAEFSLSERDVLQGRFIESQAGGVSKDAVLKSELALRASLQQLGYSDVRVAGGDQTYLGKVVADSSAHLAQDIGRKVAVIHDLRNLDKVALRGDELTVKYENDRGRVSRIDRESQGVGR